MQMVLEHANEVFDVVLRLDLQNGTYTMISPDSAGEWFDGERDFSSLQDNWWGMLLMPV